MDLVVIAGCTQYPGEAGLRRVRRQPQDAGTVDDALVDLPDPSPQFGEVTLSDDVNNAIVKAYLMLPSSRGGASITDDGGSTATAKRGF